MLAGFVAKLSSPNWRAILHKCSRDESRPEANANFSMAITALGLTGCAATAQRPIHCSSLVSGLFPSASEDEPEVWATLASLSRLSGFHRDNGANALMLLLMPRIGPSRALSSE